MESGVLTHTTSVFRSCTVPEVQLENFKMLLGWDSCFTLLLGPINCGGSWVLGRNECSLCPVLFWCLIQSEFSVWYCYQNWESALMKQVLCCVPAGPGVLLDVFSTCYFWLLEYDFFFLCFPNLWKKKVKLLKLIFVLSSKHNSFTGSLLSFVPFHKYYCVKYSLD